MSTYSGINNDYNEPKIQMPAAGTAKNLVALPGCRKKTLGGLAL